MRFYRDLPEDKIIRQDSLKKWQEKLLKDGYTPGSVNAFVSAANAYLDYIGHREYQLAKQLKEEKVPPLRPVQPLVGGEEPLDIVLSDSHPIPRRPMLPQGQFLVDLLSRPWHRPANTL